MRHPHSPSLSTLVACMATAFFLVATVFIGSAGVLAAEPKRKAASAPTARCTCPEAGGAAKSPAADPAPGNAGNPWSNPKFSDAKATLDQSDEIATLEALQVTLSEMGDGTTYVWHRGHGRLSGAFQATSSFKDATGKVCRHVVMILSSGTYNRKSEGIACRLATGVWQLEG